MRQRDIDRANFLASDELKGLRLFFRIFVAIIVCGTLAAVVVKTVGQSNDKTMNCRGSVCVR